MGMISEFKAFAMRGNVVDMAVGVVIGAAFGKIVSAMVDKMIMPIVGYMTSGQNFSEMAWKLGANPDGTPMVSIGYGAFLQSMLDFVIVAFMVFLFAKKVGLLDNIWLLIIFYTVMNLPIAIWMLRSFLAEVPSEMLEAAEVDGAGLILTLRKVVAPVVMPGLASAALICFIFSWNELLFARVLTGTVSQTAPVYLTGFVTSQGLFLAKVCAASLVVSLPVLVAGFAAQDKLVQGLSMGAVR